MGIIDLIKGRSPKDIRLKQDISMYLVFPYLLKKNRVWLDKKAVVPENTLLVFATRGKILDTLPTGEHKLTPTTLPNSSNKFKLYKPDKNGNPPANFKAFTYFINTAEMQNFKFTTYKKLHYENELDGKFWVKLDFELDLQILDPKKFLKSLMCEYAYLKTGEAEEILRDWLSEFTTTELEKIPYRKTEFETQLDEITARIAEKLSKHLSAIGVKQNALRAAEIAMSKDKKQKHKNPLMTENEQEKDFEALEAERIYAEEEAERERIRQERQINPYIDPHLELANRAEKLNEKFEYENIKQTEEMARVAEYCPQIGENTAVKTAEKIEAEVKEVQGEEWSGLEKF